MIIKEPKASHIFMLLRKFSRCWHLNNKRNLKSVKAGSTGKGVRQAEKHFNFKTRVKTF